MKEQLLNDYKDDAYSQSVRAGKRTYFFDVKETKNNDFFLTITESKRLNQDSGDVSYEKHKIFLYPEDFKKFIDELIHVQKFIESHRQQNFNSIDKL